MAIIACQVKLALTAVFLYFSSPALVAQELSVYESCLHGKNESKVVACRKAIEKHGSRRNLYLELGQTLDQLKRFKESISVYEEALSHHPGNKQFSGKLGIAKSNLREQEWVEERKSEKQTTSNSKSKTSSTVQAKLDKILCMRLSGEATLNACNQALQVFPRDPNLLRAKGDKLMRLGRLSEAKETYEQMLKVNPSSKVAKQKLLELSKSGDAPEQILAKEKKDQEKLAREQADRERKLAQEKAAKDKLARDQADREKKLAQEKATKEKLAQRPLLSAPPVTFNSDLTSDHQEFVNQLRLLVSLHAQGLINEVEFNRRKALLLDNKFRVAAKSSIVAKSNERAGKKEKPSFIRELDFGAYHALIIGNNGYQHLPELDTAMSDAKAVSRLLEKEYGFEVKLLTNATRYDILKALGEFRHYLTEKDNFLIYYAGHGILDKRAERGYWLPVDAEQSIKANWISTTEISDSLKALEPNHIMVIADSCYSGTLVRGSGLTTIELNDKKVLIKRLLEKKSRTVLTSGGLEPVMDSGGGGHSVFARAFLDVLSENDNVLEGQRLFTILRRKVVLNADQTPEYSDIRKAGHNGGDFIFVKK